MVKHFETPQEKEAYLETIRQQSLREVDTVGFKQRFGLFSQLPPTAVGDNSYDPQKKYERNELGKPKTLPRNIQTNPAKKGKTRKSFFQEMSYVTIGDKYQDEYKLRMIDEMQKKAKQPKEVPEFRYSSGYKLIIKAPYEHKSDFVEIKKEIRDSNGRVITQNPNVKTSQRVKGLYKYPDFMKDEYDRVQQQITKQRLDHDAKMKDIPPFKSQDRERERFTPLRDIYFEDPAIKKKPQKEIDFKIMKHEVPFKPSNPPKEGYNKSIGKYPKYMGDPIKDLVRKPAETEKKDIFKLNNPKLLERPTPSVAFHPINIRKEMRRSIN